MEFLTLAKKRRYRSLLTVKPTTSSSLKFWDGHSVERHSVPFFSARSDELLFVATPLFSVEDALH